jgi:putative transcriptional regulator
MSILSVLLISLIGTPALAQAPVAEPAPGVLLVATEDMPDPRFWRSVILLLEHDDSGTLGLIINRPTDVPLHEALPELPASEHAMYWGGPVAENLVLLLGRGAPPEGQSEPVLDEVWWSADGNLLESALAAGIGQDRLRVFLGHAGWAPGQLAGELDRDSWALFRAEPEQMFSSEPETLWDSLMGGGRPLLVLRP